MHGSDIDWYCVRKWGIVDKAQKTQQNKATQNNTKRTMDDPRKLAHTHTHETTPTRNNQTNKQTNE